MNISTDLSIRGTEVKPVIDGKISVDKGTSLTFVVPQGNEGAESKKELLSLST
jgi:hypothetical protein